MKTKYNLQSLIILWIKWTGMVEIKHKEFIDVVPIMPRQNSSWIMGSRIYREGRTQGIYCEAHVTSTKNFIYIQRGQLWI